MPTSNSTSELSSAAASTASPKTSLTASVIFESAEVCLPVFSRLPSVRVLHPNNDKQTTTQANNSVHSAAMQEPQIHNNKAEERRKKMKKNTEQTRTCHCYHHQRQHQHDCAFAHTTDLRIAEQTHRLPKAQAHTHTHQLTSSIDSRQVSLKRERERDNHVVSGGRERD